MKRIDEGGPLSFRMRTLGRVYNDTHTHTHTHFLYMSLSAKEPHVSWLFLGSENMYEPEAQMEFIFVFASREYRKGFRSTHLKAVGKAMEAVFQLILQGVVCVVVYLCVERNMHMMSRTIT